LAPAKAKTHVFFAQNGYQVLSTDFSSYALKISKQKSQNIYPKLKFKKLDLSKPLPFPNNHFHIVYSHLGLHYFNKKDTKKLFVEIHRVLKPHGVFASIFNTTDDPEIQEGYKLEKNYYVAPDGLFKSYFSTPYLTKLIQKFFYPIILDNQGTTHKDEIRTLIRLIATKI
jgi:ubiquinone/menaquinone biosynthesis C-methylase UbiE